LVEEHVPIFKFHKKERYFPCTVEHYLSKCVLYYDGKIVLDYGEVTKENLPSQQYLDPVSGEINYSNSRKSHKWGLGFIYDEDLKGSSVDNLNDQPVYAHVKVIII
jgi:hypothetical protein